MIEKPTVLVLGAGASMPYGYPSGAELRQRLISEDLFQDAIDSRELSREDVVSFCETFRHSGMPSIDAPCHVEGKIRLLQRQRLLNTSENLVSR